MTMCNKQGDMDFTGCPRMLKLMNAAVILQTTWVAMAVPARVLRPVAGTSAAATLAANWSCRSFSSTDWMSAPYCSWKTLICMDFTYIPPNALAGGLRYCRTCCAGAFQIQVLSKLWKNHQLRPATSLTFESIRWASTWYSKRSTVPSLYNDG